jgi:putative ABC transport system permease protein
VLLALAIVIAFFGIMNTLALSIVERTHELGLLRAVGMTRRQLKSMVRWESVLIALFGTIGGLGVGLFFGWSTIRALDEQGFHVFHVPIAGFVAIAVFAAFFGVVAAMLPARRAAKLDILRAIAAE